MPITRIEVNEYNCMQCGYKWINRINGEDGPIPKYCAKCKRSTWNGEAMSAKEKGLRAVIINMGEFYMTAGAIRFLMNPLPYLNG